MSFTAKIDNLTHDIHIMKGRIVLTAGTAEITQRIRIALLHELNEYFLDRQIGFPWYSQILGSKMTEAELINLIRPKIERVPGVRQVTAITVKRIIRDYTISVTCYVNESNNPQTVNVTVEA